MGVEVKDNTLGNFHDPNWSMRVPDISDLHQATWTLVRMSDNLKLHLEDNEGKFQVEIGVRGDKIEMNLYDKESHTGISVNGSKIVDIQDLTSIYDAFLERNHVGINTFLDRIKMVNGQD